MHCQIPFFLGLMGRCLKCFCLDEYGRRFRVVAGDELERLDSGGCAGSVGGIRVRSTCYAAFFFFSIACGMVRLRSSGFEVSVICIDFFLLGKIFFLSDVMRCSTPFRRIWRVVTGCLYFLQTTPNDILCIFNTNQGSRRVGFAHRWVRIVC